MDATNYKKIAPIVDKYHAIIIRGERMKNKKSSSLRAGFFNIKLIKYGRINILITILYLH